MVQATANLKCAIVVYLLDGVILPAGLQEDLYDCRLSRSSPKSVVLMCPRLQLGLACVQSRAGCEWQHETSMLTVSCCPISPTTYRSTVEILRDSGDLETSKVNSGKRKTVKASDIVLALLAGVTANSGVLQLSKPTAWFGKQSTRQCLVLVFPRVDLVFDSFFLKTCI